MEKVIEAAGNILGISLLRYFFIAGVPFFLIYYLLRDKLITFKIQKRLAKKKDLFREILFSTQTTFIFTFIAVIIAYTPFREYTLLYDNFGDYPIWWFVISLLLSLVIHDTYFYWMHRLLHHRKIYKITHKLHHRSINPSPWASYSFSTLEAVAEGLVLLVIVFILPVHELTILLFTIVSFIINVYGHLGYEIAPKSFRNSFLFKILNTSTYHNMHHSRFYGNYGLYFRVWDRLMKTENPDYLKEYDKIQERRFGVRKA